MTDRELLELAAKAAGYTLKENFDMHGEYWPWCDEIKDPWHPLTDDGDALRLAVKLGVNLELHNVNIYTAHKGAIECSCEGDPYAATRRAIVRAAAEIGKAQGDNND